MSNPTGGKIEIRRADIGDEVDPDTIVCIIEVMKLMNSILAGAHGVVTQILAADGDPVEYGQILMVIDPR